jgi:hypothetical protein
MPLIDLPKEECLGEFRFELLPPRLLEYWKSCPKEFTEMNELTLRKTLRSECQMDAFTNSFSLLTKVRITFWEEYERAARVPEQMVVQKMYMGTCRSEVYYKLFDRHPALIAWVICPFAGFLLQRKELEFLAEERMVEVLSAKPIGDDGKVDSRLAKVQLELYGVLQDRLYGAVTQKIESQQKNLNVNIDAATTESAARTISLITNVDELDKRIQAIQEKRKALQQVVQPFEINQQKLMRPDQVE